MFESVLQVLAYTGVGLVILVIGFFVLDVLTPGKLGQLGDGGQPGRRPALRHLAGLARADPVLRDLLHRRRLGRARRRGVFGIVGVAAQAVGFFILDLLIPGKLAEHCFEPKFHPAAWVTAGIQIAVALVICASLT